MNEQSDNQNLEHAVKFFLFSISAGAIQAITFALLHEIVQLVYWPSYLIALILSVLWNFTLNRKFTFKSAANVPKAMMKVFVFYLIFTPASTWWGNELTILSWNAYIILFGTMIINLVSEFVYTKYFIYKNQINTALNIELFKE